jgi:WD40 repeat protein
LQLETWLAEFEEAWDEHRLPAHVERLPPPSHALRLPALIELIKIDLERSWQHGRQLRVSDYVARYPELGPVEVVPPDLFLAEDEVRRQFGEVPATFLADRNGPGAGSPTLASDAPPDAPPGASRVLHVRGYEVLGKLGQGGMGAVYKARHLRLNRVVALKVVADTPNARPADLVRFRQEAEVIARLQHPNIVQIYEVGEYAGGSYLALEFVDGPALDRQVSGTPHPPRQTAQLVETLARAIHYAHGQGVIHRDLKPANVLMTGAGAPKITDFGLARLAALDSGLTTAGAIMGTPSYMAPEQADGRLQRIGPHTDTYALGAILYECLTGRAPFQGATILDTLVQVRQHEPVPPHRLLGTNDRTCPADLETICLKCLEKDSHRRYASAGALADDLGRYLAGTPIAARPVGPVGRAWRWARRNRGWAAMLGAVASLLLVIAVGSSLLSLQLKQALRASEEQRWVTLAAQARASSRSRGPGQRFEGLEAIRQALQLPVPPGHSLTELRNEAIACLALPDWRPKREWGYPADIFQWDSDEQHRVYARNSLHSPISVRRVDTDEVVATLDGFPGGAWLSLSPDGRFLVCWQPRRQRVWDLASSPPALLIEHDSGVMRSGFHPDGRHLANLQDDGSILLYDLTAAPPHPQRLAKLDDGLLTKLAFDRDGNNLAVVTASGGAVHVLDARSGKAKAAAWRPQARVNHLAWHPDGKLLAAACDDSRIIVWDTTRGQQAAMLEGCCNGGLEVVFSPDGEFIVSSGWENKVRFWHWRTGAQVLSHMGGSNLRFSREGRMIIGAGGRLKLVEVALGGEYRSLMQQSSPAKDIAYWRGAIHPDGRLLAVAMSDGARLWDLDTGGELAWLKLDEVRGVAFAPNALLTNSQSGLSLWPIHADAEHTALGVGPPRRLNAVAAAMIGCSKDGQLIAQAARNETLVLHRDRPERPLRLRSQRDVRSAALSPDGRFVATGSHNADDGIKIWDMDHDQPIKELPLGTLSHGVFSPDGKWLAACGAEGSYLLTVGSWEAGPPIPRFGSAAFSPQADLLALETGEGVIRLLDPATGHETARLADPHQDRADWLGFTPDGTRLVAVSEDGRAIHVWDLRRIRTGLVDLGLDWVGPVYREAERAAPAPLEVRIIGADALLDR